MAVKPFNNNYNIDFLDVFDIMRFTGNYICDPQGFLSIYLSLQSSSSP